VHNLGKRSGLSGGGVGRRGVHLRRGIDRHGAASQTATPAARNGGSTLCDGRAAIVDQTRSLMFEQSGTSFRHELADIGPASMNSSNFCSAICAPRAYNRNALSAKACHE
jgi:hypothetical protein